MNPILLLLLAAGGYLVYEKKAAAAPASGGGAAPALPSSAAQLPASSSATSAPAPAPAQTASPSSSPSSSTGVGASQAVTGTAPWDPSTMADPAINSQTGGPSTVALPAIPASYAAQSDETTAIQNALNSWAAAALYPNPQGVDQIATDGLYGPDTQTLAAAFQIWQNATAPGSNLTIDGLAGPATQNFLLDFGQMAAGSY